MSKSNEIARQKCPTWCTAGTAEYPCHGEHRGDSTYGYVPATGGFAVRGAQGGTLMHAVATSLCWPEPWGEGYSVSLHVVGDDDDLAIDFKPSEALTFAAALIETIAEMVEGGVKIMFDVDRVETIIENAEAIRDAHAQTKVVEA